ncbi:receptor-like serine/threonine-protein kinase SD1-6 isoform X2 [Triticum dicoccoides]|uniref:receptor-like serine/threonine-protein kinase SD1-6 isoform X2 n=1 Tax=Triticum dicoccoides TaxID=85692 RepID=UPI00188E446D|nr:receptor-like serine/threonine-protein kinase SD1-6 isoform X2 [Triticum dicoccoides]
MGTRATLSFPCTSWLSLLAKFSTRMSSYDIILQTTEDVLCAAIFNKNRVVDVDDRTGRGCISLRRLGGLALTSASTECSNPGVVWCKGSARSKAKGEARKTSLSFNRSGRGKVKKKKPNYHLPDRMVDAVGSVKQVVQVALKIKEAADTVRHNKEVCHQIRGRVNRLRAILSKLEGANTMSDSATSDTLRDLEETLHRAYRLVHACREKKNIVSLLFTAGKLSRQLRQVNDDILAQMAVASFGNNVQTTIMLSRHFQDPPKEQEQMGLSMLFREDAEHAIRSPDKSLTHDSRLEGNDGNGAAPQVDEPSRIPKIPHASLPWFTVFTYAQLTQATNSFSCELGSGGSGVVYKGSLHDGRQVAVKRTSIRSPSCKVECEKEVRLAAVLQHINILKLVGCCTTETESFHVYEFMRNGSLHDHIHGKRRDTLLPWPMRFQIVEGIAQGLLYLHKQCGLGIIHMDIKLSNILLDDAYIPKVGDFGISLVLPQFRDEKQTFHIRGSIGFMAPEMYSCGRFSIKTDVYSYGVLLLETISGKSCVQAGSDFNTLFAWAWHLWKARKLAEFIDSRVRDVADVSEIEKMKRCIHIALLCIELNPAHRPTMSDILGMLGDKKLELPIPQQPAGTNENSLDSSDNELSDWNPHTLGFTSA